MQLSIESKQARLKELSNPNLILSDQEYEEKERLEDELNMIHAEETQTFKQTNIPLGEGKINIIPIKKKRSLLDIVLQKIKKKPATWDEIQQLKLERTKAILKRDISEANYRRKNPGGKQKKSKTFSTTNRDIEREFNSTAKDFKDMSGSNNKDKYKGLI